MTKHAILFLAAIPHGTDPRALDREARAIQVELKRSGIAIASSSSPGGRRVDPDRDDQRLGV